MLILLVFLVYNIYDFFLNFLSGLKKLQKKEIHFVAGNQKFPVLSLAPAFGVGAHLSAFI